LLLDEFDAVAKLRDDPHELGEVKRVVNTLLQCIDSRAKSGFTIAITNHESLLDPAVWRRFDIRIHVPKPDITTRISIAKANFSTSVEDEPYVKFIAWVTDGQSGSDIEKLSDFVKRNKVLRKDLFSVYEAVKQYIKLSASETETHNRCLVQGEQDELAVALAGDKNIPFSQENLAVLLNSTQSSISRMLRKRKSN
jgi:SpoVK/Ycf46/Vps4 family AAA+-type ATPase